MTHDFSPLHHRYMLIPDKIPDLERGLITDNPCLPGHYEADLTEDEREERIKEEILNKKIFRGAKGIREIMKSDSL